MKELFPFFYQAYTELGLYGYRIDHVKDYLKIFKENVSNYRTFIPESFDLTFNKKALLDVKNWLDEHGNNMINIYGGQDAWSSTAYHPTDKTNSLIIMKKGGNHRTRISNLPDEQKNKVITTINKWLAEPDK